MIPMLRIRFCVFMSCHCLFLISFPFGGSTRLRFVIVAFHWLLHIYILFCDERECMFLSHDNQADIIDAFNSTSKYPDGLLNIYNIYFKLKVDQI